MSHARHYKMGWRMAAEGRECPTFPEAVMIAARKEVQAMRQGWRDYRAEQAHRTKRTAINPNVPIFQRALIVGPFNTGRHDPWLIVP